MHNLIFTYDKRHFAKRKGDYYMLKIHMLKMITIK